MAMPVNPLRMSLTIMFYGFQFPRGRRAISTFAPPCLDSKFAPYFIFSISSRWASILITMLHWTPGLETPDHSISLYHRLEIKKIRPLGIEIIVSLLKKKKNGESFFKKKKKKNIRFRMRLLEERGCFVFRN